MVDGGIEFPERLSEHEVDVLLSQLCIRLGFCLPPSDIEQLIANPPRDVKSFTDAVIAREGLNPETYDRHIYRQVRDMVREAFSNAQPGPARARRS